MGANDAYRVHLIQWLGRDSVKRVTYGSFDTNCGNPDIPIFPCSQIGGHGAKMLMLPRMVQW